MSTHERPAVRGRRSIVVPLLALGAASLASSAPVWFRTFGSTALDDRVEIAVTGTTASPALTASALVVVAAALALGLVGRIGRWVVLAVITLAGLVVCGSALVVVLSPGSAASAAIATATGIVTSAQDVDLTVVPYVPIVLGLLVVLVAVRAMVAPVEWTRSAPRFEPAAAQGDPREDEQGAWDALTKGEDPT